MSNYVANCKISGPRRVQASPDVDFNGLMWSYTIGLMFPPTAADDTIPIQLPNATSKYVPGTPSP
jgi:hypothetical protein